MNNTEKIIKLEELVPNFNFIGKEKAIVKLIINNIDEISHYCGWGEIERYKPEFMMYFSKTNRIICDIMIWHKNGTGTVIEAKNINKSRNNTLSAIGQVLMYGIQIEKMFKNMPRLVIATTEINYDLYDLKQRYNLPIQFLMLDGNRAICLK